MDNQLSQSAIPIQKLIVVVTIVGLAIAIGIFVVSWYQRTDCYAPYVKEVLSLKGNVSKGHDIYLINCAGCHGSQGTGSVGPNLQNVSKRKSQADIIKQVVSGKTPPMPKFQPNSQEMADLLGYLEKL